MAKVKKTYKCSNCGYDSPKWIGKCPVCNNWNTLQEELVSTTKLSALLQNTEAIGSEPIKISEIISGEVDRIDSKLNEFNRILGGGIIPGSLMLFGGEPGIGKSTIALQIALNIPLKVLYNSGEESATQIKLRANRIEQKNQDCYILNEQSVEKLLDVAKNIKPALMVIDSIQTISTVTNESLPGSMNQLRECTHILMNYAKRNQIPILIIGHITKEGALAGPKLLEHMVDVVLLFEGDMNYNYRMVRTLKNRFGAVPELAVYEMKQNGLNEVLNPSSLFFHFDGEQVSGVVAANTISGVRPIFTEVQTLVSNPVYATPQRNTTGFDIKRLNMLLAIIDKKLGLKVLMKDVFLNVSGGLRVDDPASDLALVMAIISSHIDKPLNKYLCFCAELSLTGELKPVSKIQNRIAEAERIGFKTIVVPEISQLKLDKPAKIKIAQFKHIKQVVKIYFAE